MDLNFSETQQMLRESARAFLNEHAPRCRLGVLEASTAGYDPDTWQKIVRNGWTEMPFGTPGNADLGHLACVLQEFGRSAYASPYFQSVAAAGIFVHRLGRSTRACTTIDRIAGGDTAVLIASPDAGRLPQAKWCRGSLSVSAGPLVVEWAHVADVLVVPARLEDGRYVLVEIDSTADGARVEPVLSMDNERLALVTLSDVVVGEQQWLHEEPVAPEVIEEGLVLVDLLRAAEMVGGIEEVLRMTVEYMKIRNQFGRPIGSFQAVQHACADMNIQADGAFLATCEAISKAEADLPFVPQAAAAVFFTGRAYEGVTTTAAQLHGGVGFMAEHPLQYYFRRAKAQRLRLGSEHIQLARAASHLIDPLADNSACKEDSHGEF